MCPYFSWFCCLKGSGGLHSICHIFVFLFKVVNEDNATCIPNNSHHNLTRGRNCLCLFLEFVRFSSSMFWLLFCLGECCGGSKTHQWLWIDTKIRLDWHTEYQTISWNILSTLLWSTVNKCSTRLVHRLVIHRCSCKVLCTHSVDIPAVSAISLIFVLRSVKTILWILSGVVTSMAVSYTHLDVYKRQ